MALQQPHADLAVPERFRQPFVGQFDETPHPPGGHYREETHPAATYAGMITYLDDFVGQILDELRRLNIDDQTLVIFSSDNGSYTEGGYHYRMLESNSPLSGGKRDLYEGGIRVPMLAWWPGTVPAGRRTDHISAFWDFAPTALELAGAEVPEYMDGISYLPTLLGNSDQQRQHEYLYWEFYEQGGKQAVRYGVWKGIRLNVSRDRAGPLELYHLENDVSETTDVADEFPEIVEKLERLMEEAHEPSERFRF